MHILMLILSCAPWPPRDGRTHFISQYYCFLSDKKKKENTSGTSQAYVMHVFHEYVLAEIESIFCVFRYVNESLWAAAYHN